VPNVGFRIFTKIERLASSVVERYFEAKLPTPNIADVMGRFGAIGQGIRSINEHDMYLVGTAFTVRVPPSDNLMVHKAMDLAEPGDVIVVEAGGDMTHAILGELMCMYAEKRGIRGFIVDGPVRDGAAIRRLGYPVFAKGLTPRGPYKDGPGEINVPISCGGATVHPGDVILGDMDGAVVVPKDSAEEILEKASATRRDEEKATDRIANGQWERRWVDETLREKGCELIE
jgi:regulator of RNase E activity RraA